MLKRLGLLLCVLPWLWQCASQESGSWLAVRVEKGDTLFSIASAYGISVQSLVKRNHLKNPDYLRDGDLLWVPAWAPLQQNKVSQDQAFSAWLDELGQKQPAVVVAKPKPKGMAWIKPLQGEVIDKGLGGIEIIASSQKMVKAARSGEVLYAGYLTQRDCDYVVIRHYSGFISVYQGIKNALAKVGTYIHQGDDLGYLEQDNEDRYVLHFEIRQGAKRLSTLALLNQ